MIVNLSDVFASFAKLSAFDKRFQTRKLRESLSWLADYLNNFLFSNCNPPFTIMGTSIYFDNCEVIRLNIDDLSVQTFELFSQNVNKVVRRILRNIINQNIYSCEQSNCDLIDVHREINEIYNKDGVKLTQRVKRIRSEIEKKNKNPIIIFGDSSSGKTVSTIQAIEQVINVGQTSYTWIDLSDVNIEIEHFVYTLSIADKRQKHIIVVDNAQSHPSKVFWLIKAVEFLEKYYSWIDFKVINICWGSARKTIVNFYMPKIMTQIECSGYDIIEELIRIYSLEKYEKDIKSNSFGDVLIAKSTIEFIIANGIFPNEKQLAHDLFRKTTNNSIISDDAIKVLYTIASLGEFEIHVRSGYLDSISKNGFEELLSRKILRTYKTEDNTLYVAIGHRSLAHKILCYLKTVIPDAKSPIELAIEYLSIYGESQILATLERLDLELETNDSMMAKLWQAFCNMRDSVFKQVALDPTWGNNMASMIFATEALNNMMLGEEISEALKRTCDEINKRWIPAQDNSGIVFIGDNYGINETTEIVDFIDNIKRTMTADEKNYSYESDMQADKLDYYRFHDNWLLGLLLGFEGNLNTEGETKAEYIKCAEQMQQPNGAFYPDRVCWVTARVIMGLSDCGLSYSSPVIKRACHWLIDQLVDKDTINWSVDELKCCGWRSGTGSWNSNEQITLMCICALFKAQYPIKKSEKVSSIINEFWRCRKSLEELFVKKGSVLDIVWIIDAMLFDNRNPIELQQEIKDLTDYVLTKWNNASLLSSEKETESSDVSFMAKELLAIVWALLNKNMPLLLKGLELDYSQTNSKKEIFISYRREEGGGSAFAQSLYQRLEYYYKGNVFLDVYDLNYESSDFEEIIESAVSNSKVVIAIVSDHCFDRACDKDYKNEQDVFFNELNSAINQGKSIIAIYNSSSKKTECPDELKVNPEFYKIAKALSKRNASFYDATVPDAMSKLSDEVVNKIKHINI